jgi:succinate-acetate transporter protein
VLVLVVPLQALSSVFGFLARDPAASTGMAVQGGGWFAIGISLYSAQPGRVSPALGLVLLGVATVLLVPVTVAAFGKVLASFVMLLTALRFYLTGAYELSSGHAWETAAAVVGLILAAAALYAGLAFELEDSRGVTTLPTFRRRQGETAITGDLIDEIHGVQHEAGVRRKL